jgi:hypothetical protein
MLLPLLGLTNCVKQKNCDCGLTGKFVYYEKPQKEIVCGYEHLITAFFIPDYTWTNDSAIGNITPYYGPIVGNVPKEYQTTDTIHVTVCLKEQIEGFCLAYGWSNMYKLKCIEKVNVE